MHIMYIELKEKKSSFVSQQIIDGRIMHFVFFSSYKE